MAFIVLSFEFDNMLYFFFPCYGENNNDFDTVFSWHMQANARRNTYLFTY